MTAWYVYLLECRDGSIYTGIATDVERRYAEHAAGKGARYTRSRPPLRLLALRVSRPQHRQPRRIRDQATVAGTQARVVRRIATGLTGARGDIVFTRPGAG